MAAGFPAARAKKRAVFLFLFTGNPTALQSTPVLKPLVLRCCSQRPQFFGNGCDSTKLKSHGDAPFCGAADW